MKVKIVSRSKIRVSRKSRSKYDKLKEAIDKLEPNGDAIQVNFNNEKELNSIRNIAYAYNKENNSNVKSSADASKKTVFFYLEK